jgi:hypothetical protein
VKHHDANRNNRRDSRNSQCREILKKFRDGGAVGPVPTPGDRTARNRHRAARRRKKKAEAPQSQLCPLWSVIGWTGGEGGGEGEWRTGGTVMCKPCSTSDSALSKEGEGGLLGDVQTIAPEDFMDARGARRFKWGG